MKEDFQKIDGLIEVLQVIISKDRCLCSDSKKLLEHCVVILRESKCNKNSPVINWELVFKAIEIIALLFVNNSEFLKHIL